MKKSTLLQTYSKTLARAFFGTSVISVPLWLSLPCPAQTVVNFYLTQFTGATNDTIVNVTARNNPVIYNGQYYWWPSKGANLPTTNGFMSVSLIPGQYNVSLAGVPQSWTITVTNSIAPLNAADLTTATLIYNGINTLGGNVVSNDSHGNYTVSADPPGAAAAALALAITNSQGTMTFGSLSAPVVNMNFLGQDVAGGFWSWTEAVGPGGFNLSGASMTASSFSGDGAGVTNQNVANLASGNTSSSNNWVGTFAGNGGGLTNLNGCNAISGQILVQNAVALVLQTNGASPFVSPNWSAITMQTVPTLTNTPLMAFYCGYPANFTAFGYLPALDGWIYPSTTGVNCQTPETRLKLTLYGNRVGLYTEDGDAWWRSDGSSWNNVSLPSVGNNMFWIFTWPNFGRHEFEFHWNAGALAGVYWPTTNALVNTPQPVTTGIIVGDSVTDGAAGVGGEQLWPAQLQNLLMPYGINLIPQGEGGTGYTAGGTGGGTNFLYRLTNGVEAFRPDFVIWAGGINDPTNGLYAAATNCFGLLRSSLPGCKQIVVAPWSDANPASGDSVGADQIISNAAAAYNLPVIYPQYAVAASWMSGYQSVPGSGNAPLFETGNGPHPTIVGHQFIADMMANFVLTNLIPNATPILW